MQRKNVGALLLSIPLFLLLFAIDTGVIRGLCMGFLYPGSPNVAALTTAAKILGDMQIVAILLFIVSLFSCAPVGLHRLVTGQEKIADRHRLMTVAVVTIIVLFTVFAVGMTALLVLSGGA